jgi:hypothetical protein
MLDAPVPILHLGWVPHSKHQQLSLLSCCVSWVSLLGPTAVPWLVPGYPSDSSWCHLFSL